MANGWTLEQQPRQARLSHTRNACIQLPDQKAKKVKPNFHERLNKGGKRRLLREVSKILESQKVSII
jgi:hypothetical protein